MADYFLWALTFRDFLFKVSKGFCKEKWRDVRKEKIVEPIRLVNAQHLKCKDGSDYLFTSQKGGRIDRTQFFRVFQAVASVAGIPSEKRHPHVLKHSLASHLVAGNVNLALVRQALGHCSITSTMKYVGTSDGQAAEAAHAALLELY